MALLPCRTLEAIQHDEASRKAGIEMGRSVCAMLINMSDDITKTLSAEDKAKYQKEADEFESRSATLDKTVERYGNAH